MSGHVLMVVVIGAVKGDPVVHVGGLVVMIVRVVIVLPDVLLRVDLVLVQVVVHVNVRKSVLQLGVVVVGNGSEGIEQIGVNLGGLGHALPLLLLGFLLAGLHVGLHDVEIEGGDAWVSQKVEAITHAAKGGKGIGAETHH